MITDIRKDNLNEIHNDDFRNDAERYVRMYENFMSAAKDSGIGTDGMLSSGRFTYESEMENTRRTWNSFVWRRRESNPIFRPLICSNMLFY